jgi:hypothetical protein
MSHNIQINIRAPAEAHEDIRRLGELLRSRPDMVPVLEKSVRDMRRLAESQGPPAPSAGGWLLVAELEAAVGDLARRLEELERASAPAVKGEPVKPRPSSPVAQLRRKAGLPKP